MYCALLAHLYSIVVWLCGQGPSVVGRLQQATGKVFAHTTDVKQDKTSATNVKQNRIMCGRITCEKILKGARHGFFQ
jgi:hypothetical protein